MSTAFEPQSAEPAARSNFADRSDAVYEFLLFALAATLNLLAVAALQRHVALTALSGDEREYWNIATALHHLGLSGVPARRTPPYPLFLACVRALVGDDYLRVQIVLSTLLALLPALVHRLVVRQLGDRPTARVAGVATAIWPPFVRYGAMLFSDSFGLLAFAVFLAALPSPRNPPSTRARFWRNWGIAGALLGLAMQTKPLYLIYVPFAPLIALAITKTVRRGCAATAAMALGCLLALLPWAAYVSHREGHLILVSANGGETVAGGFNPALMKMDRPTTLVTGEGRETWVGPGKWLMANETGYLSPREAALPYVQMSELLGQRADRWIVTHPLDVAYLTSRKLLYMWGIYPLWNGLTQTLLGNAPLLFLLVAAAFGLWWNRSAWKELAVFWSLPLFCSAVAVVSWGSWRFRMPGDIGLLVLGATAWRVLAARLAGRSAEATATQAPRR